LKFAFMDEYYKTHRRPLRDYLFGYFHTVSAWMSPIAPLANAVMGFAPTRKLIAKATGITPNRPFPRYSTDRARVVRIGREAPCKGNPHYQKILFLSDAFTHYIEPHIEQAAFDVLARLGFEVQVIPVVGAGASLLSKGFVDAARHHAERVLHAIARLDPDASAMIVGLEPPEIYCLKNETRDLLPERRAEMESLSCRAWLLDEFLIRSDAIDKLRVANIDNRKNTSNISRIKFHPHCHQRAEGPADDGQPTGTQATVAMLRACGYEVEVTDAGCCGMAGTFGYEAEHYDLSMKVGELKLFPLVRNSSPKSEGFGGGREGVVIVSSGSACRIHIEQGTHARARHPLELVAEYLQKQI